MTDNNTNQLDRAAQAAVDDAMALIGALELPYLQLLAGHLTRHIADRQAAALLDAKAEIGRIAARVGLSVGEILASKPRAKT